MQLVKLLTEILHLFNTLSDRILAIEEKIDFITDIDDRLDTLENDLITLSEDFMAIKDQVTDLITKVQTLQDTLAEEVDELKALFEDLKARLAALEGLDIAPQLAAIDAAIAGVEALSDLGIGPDTEIPSTPANLAVSNITTSSADFTWDASTDNVGVTEYEIFANGASFSFSPTNAFSTSGLTADTAYAFTVRAKDAAGNLSAMSNIVSFTTPAV